MTADSPLCEITGRAGVTTLNFGRSPHHPPEAVWQAITERAQMRWWMPADMIGKRTAGAVVRMRFWPDLVDAKGLDPDAGTATVEVWDPPRIFEWTWHGSRIRFDVDPAADGCRLTLMVEIPSDDPDVIIDNAAGYHLWVDHLTRLLDTGSGTPIATADAQPLQATYRARQG